MTTTRQQLKVVSESQIRSLFATDPQYGEPKYVAIRPKDFDMTGVQRYEAVFYPIPDDAYPIEYRRRLIPDRLTSTNKYPIGGAVHAETQLMACLAAAEVAKTGQQGTYYQRFLEHLGSSIAFDAKLQAQTDPSSMWPIVATQPTSLTGTYTDLQRELGGFLGYGWNPDEFDHQQEQHVDSMIQNGTLNFYYPPPLEKGGTAHIWSFLKPQSQVVTVANDYDYDMAATFGGIEGQLTYPPDTGYEPILLVPEAKIRALRQSSDITGHPRYAAIRVKSSTGAADTAYELILYPTPDAAYTIAFKQIVKITRLSKDNPYPLGGAQHSETIRESCLMVAETYVDASERIHTARFMMRLAASVSVDQKSFSPERYGYNWDKSDGRFDRNTYRTTQVSYNGVFYDG